MRFNSADSADFAADHADRVNRADFADSADFVINFADLSLSLFNTYKINF